MLINVTDYPTRPDAFIWERIHFSLVVYFVVAVEDPFSNDAVVVILGMYFCADLAAMIASGHLGASIDHSQGNRHGFDPPFQQYLRSWDNPHNHPDDEITEWIVVFIIQAPLWLVQLRGVQLSFPQGPDDHMRLPIQFRHHMEPRPYRIRRISDQ